MRKAGLRRRDLLASALPAFVGANALSTRAFGQALRGTLEGALDATHAGLTPGSPEDQSAALSAALKQAELDGRPLFLPPGRYEVAEVVLPERVHILGVPGRTEIVFRGGAFMLQARQAQMVRLESITLDGGSLPLDPAVPALLDADAVDEAVIGDCLFTASGAGGLFLGNSAGRVENCRFENVGTVGLHLRQGRGMSATGNVVADCGNTGILVSREAEGEDGSIVSGNRVSRIRADAGGTGQNGNGINLDKANGVIVSSNRIDQCVFSAIRCFSSDSLTVTGNIATGSGETALYVEFASEGAIVADNFIDGANAGISFANFLEYKGRLATCSGNLVRNIRGGPQYADGNLQTGAGISAEADVAITGNVIENAIWGLQLGWGPYLRGVTASGNVIRETKIGIAVSVVEGAGPALIADNLISAAEQGAILGMRWADVSTGDLIDGRDAPPTLTIEGNRAG